MMVTLQHPIILLLFGAIIGSFLSACIYRIPVGRYDYDENEPEPETPRKTLSLIVPLRSFCPKCNATLSWWQNIPILSWLFLGGKCYHCKASIPFRYPLVELITAGLSYLSFSTFGVSPTGLVVFAFCAALVVISFIDFDYYIIPNMISLPGTAIGIAISFINDFTGWFTAPVSHGLLQSVLGIAGGAGFLWGVATLYLWIRKQDGLGLGDVKLLAMTGALFGWECSFITIFVGCVAGSILGVLLVLLTPRTFSQHLPFGPYLAFGTLFFLFNPLLTPPLLQSAPIPHLLQLLGFGVAA